MSSFSLDRRAVAAAGLAALVASAGAALAGPPWERDGFAGGPGPMRIDFAAIDADGDGSLSRAELVTRATAGLAAFDANGDGALDRAELVAAFPMRRGVMGVFAADPAEAMADRVLAMTGATAEGRVTVAALSEAQVNMLMTRLDASRDDALSAEEAERGPRGRGRDEMRGPRD